jgi:hypothetical protein
VTIFWFHLEEVHNLDQSLFSSILVKNNSFIKKKIIRIQKKVLGSTVYNSKN